MYSFFSVFSPSFTSQSLPLSSPVFSDALCFDMKRRLKVFLLLSFYTFLLSGVTIKDLMVSSIFVFILSLFA